MKSAGLLVVLSISGACANDAECTRLTSASASYVSASNALAASFARAVTAHEQAESEQDQLD